MKKPNFFIVGAPKCGTTAMHEYLRHHHSIFMPQAKELHFFGKDLSFTQRRTSEDAYFKQFSQVREETTIGEASVWYLFSKTAANEIKEFNPNAKIIIMLRNPVDMIYSNYSQCLYIGLENCKDFETALDMEKFRKEKRPPVNLNFNTHCNSYLYRDVAKYTTQVKRYFDAFGKENVHIIIFDDLKSNTASTYKKVLKFLNVDDSFQPEFKVENSNKVAKSKWVKEFLQSPIEPVKKIGRIFIPKKFRRPLLNILSRWNNRLTTRPTMDPALRINLINEFSPEVENLSILLEKNLSHWSEI